MEECIKNGFVPRECKLPIFVFALVVLFILVSLSQRLVPKRRSVINIIYLISLLLILWVIEGVIGVLFSFVIGVFILLVVRLFERVMKKQCFARNIINGRVH